MVESVILVALDNPHSLGGKAASCRKRKGPLMNTKLLLNMIVITGALHIM